MTRIYQRSLFSMNLQMSIVLGENNRYRVLANVLPWVELADIANHYRAKHVNINLGRMCLNI